MASLLDVTAARSQLDLQALVQAVQQVEDSLYIVSCGESGSLLELNLTQLARCYDVAARHKPQVNMVPLVPTAGWTIGKVASLENLQYVLAPALHHQLSFHTAMTSARPAELRPITLQKLPSNCPREKASSLESQAAVTEEGGQTPMRYEHVAVGGTFDRLHAGHRILLAAAALTSLAHLYIGITSDKLLQNKEHHDLLESYEQRRDGAVSFMKRVNPSITIRSGALTDPKEPTQAATDPRMEALVVSQETINGGHAINAYRKEHGFRPLELVIIELVGINAATPSGKLSSTELRAMEADRGKT
ncbi:hypothetical protein WJX74_002860 [Apatococcus lobatus]|uniref:Cytidyltransferase-like domain-containing protein n=1 Tax=Apatococcus lobatus TaxID=904363 RepID=A0AAW1QYI3_9CHLO